MSQRERAQPFGSAPIFFVAAAILVVLSCFIPPPGQIARATSPFPSTCQVALTLNLQPGAHDANGSTTGSVASNIPLDPVLIALPLYPGAQPTSEPAPRGVPPASPYEKSASAEYLLPTDPQSALSWYARAMASCGYPRAGQGQVVGGGMTWDIRDFASPTIPSAEIELGFAAAPNAGTGTLLVVYATVLSLPGRPLQSELISHYRRVTITYQTYGFNPPGKHLHLHLTVRKQTWIDELVLAVNAPQDIQAAPHSCGGRDWNVNLQFYPRTGKAVTVHLQCGDLQVGTYPTLIDPDNQALLTVQKMILVSCQTAACREIA